MLGNRIDRALSLDKKIQHLAARRVADRSKNVVFGADHGHAITVRKQLLTCQVRCSFANARFFGLAVDFVISHSTS